MRGQKENMFAACFAKMMAGRSGLAGQSLKAFSELVEELAARMSDGHSCLPVSSEKRAVLLQSPLVSEHDLTPFILYGNMLYLHRYFNYESRLAQQVKLLAQKTEFITDLEKRLDDVFGKKGSGEDLQRSAARLAAEKHLVIISGGPGTGKTSTVVKIIQLLLAIHEEGCRIALAAPTGKAAMRLQQSLQESLADMQPTDSNQNGFPGIATTIHRLLGVSRNNVQFKHNCENPLDLDVVIIDEASMVDLALMSKLVDALKSDARLIMLGDKDQLASVESGSVLADMIESFPQNTVILKKSYRFNEGIKQLAESINAGNAGRALQLLAASSEHDNVTLLESEPWPAIYKGFKDYFYHIKNNGAKGPAAAFNEFNRFRVLCGVRRGKFGADHINRLIELEFIGSISSTPPWYPGKPVIITRNSYGMGLFNGDIGICLEDNNGAGGLHVWFEDSEGDLKPFRPHHLPEHQTAFAMTIHKSQGSEFDCVSVILPNEESPILTRELIYTAITRAKNKVWVYAGSGAFTTAVSIKTTRTSGLTSLLKK